MFQRARGYVISEGELFKSGVTSPWLKCISTSEGIELLKKIHSGFCDPTLASDNSSPKPSGKDFFAHGAKGRPTHNQDMPSMPNDGPEVLETFGAIQLIPPTWPLQRWGIDLVGPLPTAQGNYKYAAVAVEYFTKWIKVKPLINITSETLKKILLAEHYLQVRGSKRDHRRQRQTI